MINQASITAVNKSVFRQNFRKPVFDYSFRNIPLDIFNVLAKERIESFPKEVFPKNLKYETIVLLLIDGFGWNTFERELEKSSFLKSLTGNSIVSKLTSQFPSTTASEITTMHAGVPVGVHGVYEWYYYEPEVDGVIAPFLFSFAGDKKRETLKLKNINPNNLFYRNNLYQILAKEGIESFIIDPYANSSYSKILRKGAIPVEMKDLSDGLKIVNEIISKKSDKKRYICLYSDELDWVEHAFGPESENFRNETTRLITELEKFYKQVHEKNTLVLLASDHGQKQLDRSKARYVNVLFPEILKMLKTNKKGEIIKFGGSPRDLFLYFKDEYLEEGKNILERGLKNCMVFKTSELIDEGFFGKDLLSENLKNRLGNLVVLPKDNNSVYWFERKKFEVTMNGHHGGISPEEMEIPLIVYPS